jgi:hypothetical protein
VEKKKPTRKAAVKPVIADPPPTGLEIFTPGNRISAQTAEESIFVLEYALKVTVDAVFPARWTRPQPSSNAVIPVDMLIELKRENDQLRGEIERLKKRLSKYTLF